MCETSERDYYTIPEAARRLEVSEATVWRWVRARRLPAYRVGPRRIRIRKRDLETVIRPVEANVVTAEAMKHEKQPQGIWANYDPKRVRVALRKSAGALRGVDREALLADLHEARTQGSSGRPA